MCTFATPTDGPSLPQGARITASSHYELQYILGRKIIFQCVARGKPRPRITWYKDGVELYAHNYFQVRTNPINYVILNNF